jgi:hypothetical protein
MRKFIYIFFFTCLAINSFSSEEIKVDPMSQEVIEYIQNFYQERGLDASGVRIYTCPDLQKNIWQKLLDGSETFFTSVLSSNGEAVILLHPQFAADVKTEVRNRDLSLSNKWALLYELGYHKQQQANELLDSIRDQLDFEISDVKYNAAAVEAFAYAHMSQAELLKNRHYFIPCLNFLADCELTSQLWQYAVLGPQLYQKIYEFICGDHASLNTVEKYKLTQCMAHQRWLAVNKRQREEAEKFYATR